MEAKKEEISSASLADELFGPKGSIFPPPPSKARTSEHISREETKKKCYCTIPRDKRMIDLSPYYEQQVSQPWSLCSSIYYGGQDDYTCETKNTSGHSTVDCPCKTKNTPGHPTIIYNKNLEDEGLDTRGNWWMGSLYY